MLSKNSAMTLPPLAFATPSPSRGQVISRREAAKHGPPFLKRKRTESPFPPYASNNGASFLPIVTNLPYLDCSNFSNEAEEFDEGISSPHSLPTIKLNPRSKRSREGCFLTSSQENFYLDTTSSQTCVNVDLSDYDNGTKRMETSTPNEDYEENLVIDDETPSSSMQRASSLKSMLSKRPSMNLTRSFSLQLNLSLLNLKAAATNNGENNSCHLSSSMSSIGPKRNSFIKIRTSSSLQDILSQEGDNSKELNHRRSPLTTPFDYIASTIRFPDVAIGLSI